MSTNIRTRISTILLSAGLLLAPAISISAQSHRANPGGGSHRTESPTRGGNGTSTRPGGGNNGASTRPGGSTTTSRPTTTSPSRPANNGFGSGNQGNNKPNGGGYNPGNSKPNGGNPGGGYNPGNSNNRPGGGNPGHNPGNNKPNGGGYNPGHGGNPGHGPGGNPGGGYHPGHNSAPRPGFGGSPAYSPGHGPGHGPDFGYAPGFGGPRPWARPMPPMPPRRPAYVVPGAPNINAILGITFGSVLNYGLNQLLGAGYNIVNYYNDAIYLANVATYGLVWPEVTMFYNGGLMSGARFQYQSIRPDFANYNLVYSNLCRTYGMPVSTTMANGVTTSTWWGGSNTGYITLSYGPGLDQYGNVRYYTDMIYGN